VVFLLDTNVISELRKGQRANRSVAEWITAADEKDPFLSVLVVGELTQGVERVRRRDPTSAAHLERWLRTLATDHQARILAIAARIADLWRRLHAPDPIAAGRGLLAATPTAHGSAVVTRSTADVERPGVGVLKPFRERGRDGNP